MRRLLMRVGGVASVAALAIAGLVASPAGATTSSPPVTQVTWGQFSGQLGTGGCTTGAVMALTARKGTQTRAGMFVLLTFKTGTTCESLGEVMTTTAQVIAKHDTTNFGMRTTVTGHLVTVTFQSIGTRFNVVTPPATMGPPNEFTGGALNLTSLRGSECVVSVTISTVVTASTNIVSTTELSSTPSTSTCEIVSGVATTLL